MSNNSDKNGCVGCGSIVVFIIIGGVVIFSINDFNTGTAFWIEIVALTIAAIALLGKVLNPKDNNSKAADNDDGNTTFTLAIQPEQLTSATQTSAPENNDNVNYSAKDHLRECVDVSAKVKRFMRNAQNDTELMDAIRQITGMEGIDNSEFGPYNPRLAMMVLYDVLKCHRGLGFEIAGSGRGMFAPTMIFGRILHEDDTMKLCHDVEKFRKLIPVETPVMKWVSTAVSSGFEGDTDFLLTGLMEQAEYNNKEYLTLLQNVSSCMAKAYGRESAKSKEYLDKLQKLHKAPGGIRTSEAYDKSGFEQLEELIGLDGVKSEVKRLYDFITVQQMREKEGLKTSPISYHCVFTGNPGTGKTTVARIIASIYKELGILKSGHLVETDRSGMVAEYVGQTAVKTNKIVDKALDGVLFIDEAYSLVQGGREDFGFEAIATLLKRMEDDRDRLAVVLAGYSDEMKDFINANPGLQSRFNRYIFFDDYSADDLWQIFLMRLQKQDYVIDDDAAEKMRGFLDRAVAARDRNFGNARFVRNVFEKILENQAGRLASMQTVDKKSLQRIIADDIPE